MTNEKKSQNNAPKSEQNNQHKTFITIVCTVIVTIVAMVFVMKFVSTSSNKGVFQDSTEESSRNMVVMPDNVDEMISEFENKKTQQGRYQVTMNTTWNFIDGSSASSNAYVENALANNNAVYFDIVRSDTKETIFSSPILPVGSHLEDITLDTDLDAGDYDCVLTYYLIDENQKPVSSLNISLRIIIEN